MNRWCALFKRYGVHLATDELPTVEHLSAVVAGMAIQHREPGFEFDVPIIDKRAETLFQRDILVGDFLAKPEPGRKPTVKDAAASAIRKLDKMIAAGHFDEMGKHGHPTGQTTIATKQTAEALEKDYGPRRKRGELRRLPPAVVAVRAFEDHHSDAVDELRQAMAPPPWRCSVPWELHEARPRPESPCDRPWPPSRIVP